MSGPGDGQQLDAGMPFQRVSCRMGTGMHRGHKRDVLRKEVLHGMYERAGVHGTRVGTMHIWGSGSGHFHRSSGVPTCSAGTAIRIRTGSGTLVASGTFHRMWMM